MSEIGEVFDVVGGVMSKLQAEREGSYSLDEIAFDKLAVFCQRMVFNGPVLNKHRSMGLAPFNLAPGTHGHGLVLAGQHGQAESRYFIGKLLVLDRAGIRFVEVVEAPGGQYVVSGLETYEVLPNDADLVHELAVCLRNLTSDEIRALGTHCTPGLLAMDIRFQLEKARLCLLTLEADSVAPIEIWLQECARKAVANEARYRRAFAEVSGHLLGELAQRFLSRHASADEIWHSPLGLQAVDAACILGRATQRLVDLGRASERRCSTHLETLASAGRTHAIGAASDRLRAADLNGVAAVLSDVAEKLERMIEEDDGR